MADILPQLALILVLLHPNTYISHSLFPVPKRSNTHLPELCHCQIKANAECKGANEDGRHVDGVALEEVDLGEV